MEMVATTSLPCALLPCPSKGSAATGSVASTRRLLYNKNKRKCGKAAAGKIVAKFELKPPPYALDALEPHISQETMSYHWGKHHRGYVEGLNNQIVGTDLEDVELEDIITRTYNKGNILPSFNNAAQIWNHDFFWESMNPNGGGKPSGSLLELIERDFGSFEKFTQRFTTAASTQFGSGWVWLAYKEHRLDVGNAVHPCPSEEDKKLVIVKSPNAVNPLVWNYSVHVAAIYFPVPCSLEDRNAPLLTIDVWEHAYCHDFQSRRGDYISTFMEKLVSWEVVSNRLDMAKARAADREREEEQKKREDVDGHTARDDKAVEMYLDSESDESEAE